MMRQPENPFTKDKKPLTPGLYFGLRDEIYLNDPAVSRSDILALKACPEEYWHGSWMSPRRRYRKPTAAMEEGTAFHTLLLQPELFRERYTVQPGESWAVNKKMIKRVDYDRMVECIEIIRSNEKVSQLFQYGCPEVTMVWEDPDTGVMLRTRSDFLKAFGNVDYKTTKKSLSNEALYYESINKGYHVQDVLYSNGSTILRKAIKDKKAGVFGKFDSDFVKRFIACEEQLPMQFVYQRIIFPYAVKIALTDYEDRVNAEGIIQYALSEYQRCMKSYGTDKDWMPQDDHLVLSRFRG